MIFKVRFFSQEEHVFSFHDFVEGYLCKACKRNISGPAYKCEHCSLSLHKSCVLDIRPQPHVIINPSLHGDHPLELGEDGGYPVHGELMHGFVCSKCLYVGDVRSRSYYYCGECDVAFDFFCAASTDQHSKNGNGRQIDKEELKIRHFSHEHILFFGKGWLKKKSNCSWCHRQITGMSYACSNEIACKVILHESCLNKIPREIKGHPLHPSHPLSIFIPNIGNFNAHYKASACQACDIPLGPSRGFYCRKCNFFLHTRCINLTAPTLKLNHHEHKLSYFPAEIWREDEFVIGRRDLFSCNKCGSTDGDRPLVCGVGTFAYNCRNFFYRCVQCNINIHSECIPVPHFVKYRYHEHTLFLRDPTLINEPFEEDFYCDICEEERNPNHHAYYCMEEDCEFVAHIECFISEPNEEMAFDELDVNGLVDKDQNEEDESEEKNLCYCLNGHLLSFSEVFDKDKGIYCHKCRAKICGTPAYTCENCNYYLHQVCAELPAEIPHPYHSKHPLTIHYRKKDFICDRCGDINLSSELCYRCQLCGVNLDMKCAALVPLKSEHQKVTKNLSIHLHLLTLGKFCRGEIQYFCCGCQQPFLHGGLVHCCFECRLFLHESCASSLPREMRHQQNSFLLDDNVAMHTSCSACRLPISTLAYISNLGKFHYICSTSLARALKRESHKHELYYFGVEHQRFYKSKGHEIRCTRCRNKCDGPFYSCVECWEFNKLHLDCVPIPRVVKGKCHRHPVILKDSFVEGGYDENDYYCDVCEEKRNTEHHVYVCEECPSECPFVAHVECMLSSKNCPEIKELGHVHPLSLTEVTTKDEDLYCIKCTKNIFGPAYTCGNCNFYMHKLCVELPVEIRHPSHSQHLLTLCTPRSPKDIICNLCRRLSVWSPFYICQHCGMVFDMNCAALEEGVISELSAEIDENFGHEHALSFNEVIWKYEFSFSIAKKKKKSYPIYCGKCTGQIFGPTYGCRNCNFHMHKLCAELPGKIQHPFHSQHPLTLFTSPVWKDIICDGCGYLSISHHFYHCHYCGTILDMNCAALKTKAVATLSKKVLALFGQICNEGIVLNMSIAAMEGGAAEVLSEKTHEKNLGHDHPLSLSFIEETNKDHWCARCFRTIYGPAYRCQDCRFWLHKVCAELLDTIQHPFHSQHPLTLVRIRSHRRQLTSICDQCGDESIDAMYYCQHCCIKLDMKCANSEKGVAAKRSKKVIHSNAALIFWSLDYNFE